MEQSAHPVAQPEPHGVLRQILIDLAIMTVIGVMLAFIGPFGSFAMPLAWRFVYWLSFAYIGYACFRPISYVAVRTAERMDLPKWALAIVGVLLASVPMTVAVWVLGRVPGAMRWPTLDEALQSYFYVLLIGGGVTLLFMATQRGSAAATQPVVVGTAGTPADPPASASSPSLTPAPSPTPPPSPAASPFLDRLPAHLGSDLIALEMEDHYVRAHTALGSEMILLRMRDAVAELGGIDGAQVHRSWWVARDAVEDVKRDGRNLRLVLPGGLEAPVARTRVAELKGAGWF